jgi:hypothetical protein
MITTLQSHSHAGSEPAQVRKRRLVLYPLLAAAYPVLALAAGNPGEIPGVWVLIWPIVISVLVALGTWLLLCFSIRNPDHRAFLTFVVVILFVFYGYFTIGMKQVAWATPYANGALPFVFLLAYLTAAAYLVLRLVRDPLVLTQFLTLLTTIMVGWTTLQLLWQRLQWKNLVSGFDYSAPKPVSATSASGPDIYLIVLDKYTGSESLESHFDFDNSDLESFLSHRGFDIPQTAQANYIYTALSLASLLNYRYLDEVPEKPAAQARNKAYVNHLIEDNAVWRFLRARNYRFIFFPTSFAFTGSNRYADLQLPSPRQIVSEFEIAWRRTTLAEPVVSFICQRLSCGYGITPLEEEAKLLNWRFDKLSQIPRWPRKGRPLFVFAHLTIPHEPYVFNADCSVREPFWPSYTVVQDETPEKRAYVAQIMCLNTKLKEMVDHILHDSPSPPVILLQGDHGHGRIPLHIPDFESVTPDRIEERTHPFAAYYLPGANRGIVYDSISMVNVFRTVFRQYFQANLLPLPDKTYWSPGTNIFKFTRVYHGRPWPG